jgi:hypothetical protein
MEWQGHETGRSKLAGVVGVVVMVRCCQHCGGAREERLSLTSSLKISRALHPDVLTLIIVPLLAVGKKLDWSNLS